MATEKVDLLDMVLLFLVAPSHHRSLAPYGLVAGQIVEVTSPANSASDPIMTILTMRLS
jgi:hypothetical protein